jgi:hypothetical protein
MDGMTKCGKKVPNWSIRETAAQRQGRRVTARKQQGTYWTGDEPKRWRKNEEE